MYISDLLNLICALYNSNVVNIVVGENMLEKLMYYVLIGKSLNLFLSTLSLSL